MDENIFENKKGQIGVGIENRHEGTRLGGSTELFWAKLGSDCIICSRVYVIRASE